MTKRCQKAIHFSRSKRHRVEAKFTGAEVTSNGGALLLAEADRRGRSVAHSTLAIVRQRVQTLALGHEDLNDHGALRRDPALQANLRFACSTTSTTRRGPGRASGGSW